MCCDQRAAPGMLSVTTSFVCFLPAQVGAPGTAAANPRLDAASASGVGVAGSVKIAIDTLTVAERTQRWRPTVKGAKSKDNKAYSIVLTHGKSGRHTFDGVLHCDLVLQLLQQAASALGVSTNNLPDALTFEKPAGAVKTPRGTGPAAVGTVYSNPEL